MTISTTVNEVTHVGDGSTVTFPFGFIIPSGAMRVYLVNDGKAELLEPSAYGVTGFGDPAGGSITLVQAPLSSQTLIIKRYLDPDQLADLEPKIVAYAETVEGALDHHAMVMQQLQSELSRAVKVPIGSDQSPDDLLDEIFSVGDSAPIGQVAAFAMTAVPNGWLECNGAAISRATFADLFTAIGETYGAGDGSTTFALPDYSSKLLAGSSITLAGGSDTELVPSCVGWSHNPDYYSINNGTFSRVKSSYSYSCAYSQPVLKGDFKWKYIQEYRSDSPSGVGLGAAYEFGVMTTSDHNPEGGLYHVNNQKDTQLFATLGGNGSNIEITIFQGSSVLHSLPGRTINGGDEFSWRRSGSTLEFWHNEEKLVDVVGFSTDADLYPCLGHGTWNVLIKHLDVSWSTPEAELIETTDVAYCIKAFHASVNPTELDLSNLANDVATLSARLDALES